MTVDKSNGTHRGRIYVVYSERENGNGRAIISIRFSDNQGTTWSAAHTVSIPNGRQSWFPWVSVDDTNGDIYVVYYSLDEAAGFNTNTYVAISYDGGVSFVNQRISDVPHVTNQILEYCCGYAGDYIGISAHSGRAFASWMDNRTGQWQVYVSEVRDMDVLGDDAFCNTSNIYTIANLPQGATIQWQATPAGVVNINSPTSAQTTLTKITDGVITLSAVITSASGGQIVVPKENIRVGIPNLAISASISVCNNRPSYYSINLPSGSNVVWSSSPSGKVNLTPAGTNGVLATPINSPTGAYTLIGTVTSSCGTASAQLPITFNTTPPPYNCLQIGNGNCLTYIYKCTEQFYAGATYDIPNHPSDVAYWHWTVQGGHFTNGSTSQIVPYVPIYVKPDQPNMVCSITISPMNECMIESTNEPFRYVLVNTGQHCSGYYYMMSPNPASNEVTISMVDNSSETNVDRSITAVNIYSQEGNLKKQKKFGKVKTASIPVSDLTNGMYVVEIISGDYKEQKQLIVQH